MTLDRSLQCSYTIGMTELRFEWDERKSLQNKRKQCKFANTCGGSLLPESR